MPDMLVKLYTLPDYAAELEQLQKSGIDIRRGLVAEKHVVAGWVRKHYSETWVSEAEIAFAYQPPSCFLAIESDNLLGFACYDTSNKGFFGPTGVSETARGRGIGKMLLLVCLQAMAAQGYGYAIIGAVGPVAFYEKIVGATVIEDSDPGVYRGVLPSS